MISLKNKSVSNIVKMKNNKIEDEFSQEELNKIIELVYDGNVEDYVEDDLSDLKYFKNLEFLTLVNFCINKKESKNIFTIPKLKELVLYDVKIEYLEFLTQMNLESLSFINCCFENNVDFSKLNFLKSIELVNMKEVDLKQLEQFKSLTSLSLSYSNIKNIELLKQFDYLEEIDLDNTNVQYISFLNEWKNLKKISLSEEQINSNKDIINLLKEKKVKIYINNVFED